jgi:hypothetical protein
MLLLGELKEGFGGECGHRANLNFRPTVGDDGLFHCEIGYAVGFIHDAQLIDSLELFEPIPSA